MRPLLALLLFSGLAAGQPAVLKGIPGELTWRNSPAAWEIRDGETLSITSGKATDWFVDPFEGHVVGNSPMLLFQPAEDFVLSAKVTVGLRSKWDAGALVAYVNETTWVKLALELSFDKKPTLVTVVTRGLSDDCNSSVIEGSSVYLRLARRGQGMVLYASADGRAWRLLRAFSLGPAAGLRVGFSAQSPAGEAATAVFSEIDYSPRRIVDFFTGE
jgi:regulation of enolase protein 1 (concanavalin A-like superfamily)